MTMKPGLSYIMLRDRKQPVGAPGEVVVTLWDDWLSKTPTLTVWRGPQHEPEEIPRSHLEVAESQWIKAGIGGCWALQYDNRQ